MTNSISLFTNNTSVLKLTKLETDNAFSDQLHICDVPVTNSIATGTEKLLIYVYFLGGGIHCLIFIKLVTNKYFY